MIHEIVVVGPFMCNCTILASEKTKEAVVIDPGDEPKKILDVVRSLDLQVKYLLHTHAHLDHIIGTKEVKEETQAPILLHPGDEWLYQNLLLQASTFGFDVKSPPAIDRFLKDGETLRFGEHQLEAIHTPGHTPGSTSFRLSDPQRELVFSGDTLFARSIGRTDLWGGSYEQILDSIHRRLLTLEDDTAVFPGHGPKTMVGVERKKNPFLQR